MDVERYEGHQAPVPWAPEELTTAVAPQRKTWRLASPCGLVRIYLCLLPLAALVTFYLLVADRMTATSPNGLRHARYGRPFDWVEQNLSRYQPIEFPVTMEFHFTRAWYDPIETHDNWLVFAADTLIVGVGVTACFYAIVYLVKALSRRARHPARNSRA